MRFSRLYMLGILTFLLLVFVYEYRMPSRFAWEATYGHHDKQPFGCYVADSLFAASLPQGYRVADSTLYQLAASHRPRTILVVGGRIPATATDVRAMMRLAKQGCSVIIATGYYTDLIDTLGVEIRESYIHSPSLKHHVEKGRVRSRLCWLADTLGYGRHTYRVYPQLFDSYIDGTDSVGCRLLAARADTVPMAVEFRIGKGKVILSSTPLMFTNYALLDGENYGYAFRLLTVAGPHPVVRTEAYLPHAARGEAPSPLRYVISRPPLHWALLLTVLGILLFMVFTARRRQRVIPVIAPPQNHSLEFVRLVGTLYFQKSDHRDLVLKKYAYLAEELRRTLLVDITGSTGTQRIYKKVAQHAGMDEGKVAGILGSLRQLESSGRSVGRQEMMEYIDQMNEITNNL